MTKRTKPKKTGEGPRAFEGRVERALARLRAADPGARFLIGLSGGSDSVALLRALCALAPPKNRKLYALHVHHGLRGKSADGDAAFCKKLCVELGVPYKEVRLRLAKGSALAERARAARYQALEKEAVRRRADFIALAHQQDDQAETVLARLARGAPLSGLAGIPPVRGRYVRPLLGESRRKILAYLKNLEQAHREDPSNRADYSERARIRREAVPALERALRRPVREGLARAAEEAAEVALYLEEQGTKSRARLEKKESGGRVSYAIASLGKLARPVRRALWRQLVESSHGSGKRASAAHVEALEDLLLSGDARTTVALPGGRAAWRQGSRIVAGKPPAGRGVGRC